MEKLEKEISSLPQGWIAMLETSAEKILEANLNVMKVLTDKNYNVIVLSATRPYNSLLSIYEQHKIDAKKVFIIDCICKSQMKDVKALENTENVEFLQSLPSLTDMSIAIDSSIKKIKGNKCLFVDSIAAFLIHNNPNTFTAFIHTILTKMRLNMVSGLVISLAEGVDQKIKSDIVQLCDKVIRI